MKIRAKTLAILIVAVMAAGIGVASAFGFWNTKGSKQPAKFAGGQFAGLPNPSDIRGSYTWNDVAKAFGLDAASLAEAFGASSPDAKVNELEGIYSGAGLPAGSEIGTDSVRLFVSLMTGMPHVPEADTVLPAGAIPLLRQYAKADPALVEQAAARAFPQTDNGASSGEPAPGQAPAATQSAAPGAQPTAPKYQPAAAQSPSPGNTQSEPAAQSAPANPQVAAAPAEHVQAAGTMTGKTTFRDLGEWGLTSAQIRSVTGSDPGPDGMTVKEWAADKGVSFSELKAALQALLDK